MWWTVNIDRTRQLVQPQPVVAMKRPLDLRSRVVRFRIWDLDASPGPFGTTHWRGNVKSEELLCILSGGERPKKKWAETTGWGRVETMGRKGAVKTATHRWGRFKTMMSTEMMMLPEGLVADLCWSYCRSISVLPASQYGHRGCSWTCLIARDFLVPCMMTWKLFQGLW